MLPTYRNISVIENLKRLKMEVKEGQISALFKSSYSLWVRIWSHRTTGLVHGPFKAEIRVRVPMRLIIY